MMNPNSRGFTLIELMIAMAVLAGLAAIAIPSYQNYIIRTEVSESLLTMAQHGKKMINYYNKHGEWPENGDSGPLSLSSFNKDYVEYGAGSHQQIAGSANVWMTYNKYGKRIAAFMQPEIANGQVTWHCGPSVYTKRDKTNIYLPDTCQEDTLTFVY